MTYRVGQPLQYHPFPGRIHEADLSRYAGQVGAVGACGVHEDGTVWAVVYYPDGGRIAQTSDMFREL